MVELSLCLCFPSPPLADLSLEAVSLVRYPSCSQAERPESPGQQAWDEELFWWGRLFLREHYPSRQKLPLKTHLLWKEQLSW